MNKFILLVFIILFVDSMIVLLIKTYNELVRMKNKLNTNYRDLSKEITFRVDLSKKYLDIVRKFLPEELTVQMLQLIDQYRTRVSIVDIADSYYRINNCLSDISKVLVQVNFVSPEWDKAFGDSNSRIEALRVVYDDNVLKMNNTIKIPGTSFVAKLFGFVKWPYFRNA